jgi:hypothetical protein
MFPVIYPFDKIKQQKKMSVYSESGSMISLGGKEMDLECSIEKVINELQQSLNTVQYNIRQVMMCADRGENFEDEAKMAGTVEDTLLDMNRLFLDLLDITDQLVSIPTTPEDKTFFKKFKADRKLIKKQKLKEYEDAKKREKLERKTIKMDDVME